LLINHSVVWNTDSAVNWTRDCLIKPKHYAKLI
jgi:hypothetical protein